MIKICMLTLVLACVAGVGTAQITVGLNIGSVGEKSDDVRYVRVPDHKELGSKYFGYLPFETGTALFGLIMTHKHCEMEKPVMNMLQMTIQELAQALNYQTNINNEVSKTFETDATALSNRFQANKRNDERDFSIIEQIMAYSAGSVLSKYSMDQLNDASVMKTAVDEVSRCAPGTTTLSTLLVAHFTKETNSRFHTSTPCRFYPNTRLPFPAHLRYFQIKTLVLCPVQRMGLKAWSRKSPLLQAYKNQT